MHPLQPLFRKPLVWSPYAKGDVWRWGFWNSLGPTAKNELFGPLRLSELVEGGSPILVWEHGARNTAIEFSWALHFFNLLHTSQCQTSFNGSNKFLDRGTALSNSSVLGADEAQKQLAMSAEDWSGLIASINLVGKEYTDTSMYHDSPWHTQNFYFLTFFSESSSKPRWSWSKDVEFDHEQRRCMPFGPTAWKWSSWGTHLAATICLPICRCIPSMWPRCFGPRSFAPQCANLSWRDVWSQLKTVHTAATSCLWV